MHSKQPEDDSRIRTDAVTMSWVPQSTFARVYLNSERFIFPKAQLQVFTPPFLVRILCILCPIGDLSLAGASKVFTMGSNMENPTRLTCAAQKGTGKQWTTLIARGMSQFAVHLQTWK